MIDTITVQFIVAATIILLVMGNIILSLNDVPNDTVNYILKKWANGKYFFLTFAWGILGGHFFLGTKTPLIKGNWWVPPLLVVVLLFVLFLIGKKQSKDFVMKPGLQFVLLLLGVLIGHFFWSQRHLPEVDLPFIN